MREGPQQLLPLHRRAVEAGAGQQPSERIRDLRRQETVDSRIALILSGQVSGDGVQLDVGDPHVEFSLRTNATSATARPGSSRCRLTA